MKKISEWIKENIEPRKTINIYFSTHRLKEICERHLGLYISSEYFREHMVCLGFECFEGFYKIKNVNGFCYYKNTNCTFGCKNCIYYKNKNFYKHNVLGNCEGYKKLEVDRNGRITL